ncbi:hypothetical protein MSG28_015567 [Choristoneura fumiferana]|uniref:Uncharacterized protein n=1 Tax=Choristoneura fumiferana TaxID=7141 RepID=A0ACC0KAP5_CHOFU|nr:hypothetical protein MSG28_015567 [Choristoneura fumiferana]
MGDPPDPGGGTEFPLQSSIDVLVDALESSMDTDCSTSEQNLLKRKRLRVKCNLCHKRKRKGGIKDAQNDCQCLITEKDVKVNYQTPQHSVLNDYNHDLNISNNTTDTTTRMPVGRSLYVKTDLSPYIIHVQKETSNANDATILHPVTFGRFLKRYNINGIVNGTLKRIGRNRISMEFANFNDANMFLSNKILTNEKYKAFIPTFNVTRLGVIRGVPSDWSDDEVIANINVPIGSGPIIKLRRLKRKVTAGIDGTNQYVNTGTIVATFDGRTLPTRVYMCYAALPVELYIYPTIQCYNCCRFGHVKNQCRSTPRCYKCGQGHSGSNCNVEEERYWCILCKGCHQAIDKKCLEYDRQKAIKETMSKSCISYIEALKIHPPVSRVSYADALLTSPPLPNTSRDTQNSSSSQNLPNSQNVSYKKTVFLKPKAPPKLSKGYDYHAHANIVRNPVISEHKPIHNANNNKENMQISDIIKLIIQLLSQSNIVSPSNAAAIIDTLYNISKYNNGPQSQSASVELPELNT